MIKDQLKGLLPIKISTTETNSLSLPG